MPVTVMYNVSVDDVINGVTLGYVESGVSSTEVGGVSTSGGNVGNVSCACECNDGIILAVGLGLGVPLALLILINVAILCKAGRRLCVKQPTPMRKASDLTPTPQRQASTRSVRQTSMRSDRKTSTDSYVSYGSDTTKYSRSVMPEIRVVEEDIPLPVKKGTKEKKMSIISRGHEDNIRTLPRPVDRVSDPEKIAAKSMSRSTMYDDVVHVPSVPVPCPITSRPLPGPPSPLPDLTELHVPTSKEIIADIKGLNAVVPPPKARKEVNYYNQKALSELSSPGAIVRSQPNLSNGSTQSIRPRRMSELDGADYFSSEDVYYVGEGTSEGNLYPSEGRPCPPLPSIHPMPPHPESQSDEDMYVEDSELTGKLPERKPTYLDMSGSMNYINQSVNMEIANFEDT